ncbi:ESPR domain-containing protein, partial [Variovorax paradoxus]|uniref:ESPR domain-containing protein n=2 Tax=Variovorax TaxID=34072 RepID=UPI001C129D43
MNKIFRTLWNPTLGTWVAAPETSRGHSRSSAKGGDLRAVAVAAALLLGAGPVLAAGGTGGQPVGDPTLNAGSGGSNGSGGNGGLNDTTINATGGTGGSSTPSGVTAGSAASTTNFPGGATAGA